MTDYFLSNIFYFIFGTIVGSFLNSVIYRLKKNESFLKGRSYCPNCRHTLNWKDLIPVFSFLILKGKCRYCQKKISWQYPLVELATGILFFLIIFYFPYNFLFSIFYFLFSCFLIIIFVYDLKYYIIPDKIIYPAGATALIFNFQFLISNQFSIFNYSILSGLGAAIFFLIIVLASKEKWMGWGDVKLAFLMGLFLGFPKILVALFSAFFLGAITGIILIILKKKNLKSEVPFGPFLVSSTFLAIFFGEKIVNFYLHYLC